MTIDQINEGISECMNEQRNKWINSLCNLKAEHEPEVLSLFLCSCPGGTREPKTTWFCEVAFLFLKGCAITQSSLAPDSTSLPQDHDLKILCLSIPSQYLGGKPARALSSSLSLSPPPSLAQSCPSSILWLSILHVQVLWVPLKNEHVAVVVPQVILSHYSLSCY